MTEGDERGDERRERLDMSDGSEVELTDLEGELRTIAARLDPVPGDLTRAAVGAFAWRTVDADLAELVFDSLTTPDAAALVRGAAAARMLTFRAGDLAIELELSATGAGRRLIGQLVPAGPAQVEIRQPHGVLEVAVDDLGRFTVDQLAAGPVSLRCRNATSRLVVTDWISI